MWIIDICIAIIAPILIPAFDHFVYAVKKPYIILLPGNIQKLEDEEIPIFFKEFPTAFIANAIWGMTYKTHILNENSFIWISVYAFIALLSFLPILYSHSKPKKENYKRTVIIISIALLVLTVLRIIFTQDIQNINPTTASTL